MSKFVVVVFPDEAKAQEGARALRALHDEGSLSVYGTAVLVKDANGRVSVEQENRPGPKGAGLGALLGGLAGLLAGPGVALLGAAGGALMGGWRDVLNLGVGTEFVDEASRELTPGKSAVVAEVDEDRVTPLDTRMEALGGVVLRQWRADFEDEQFEKEIDLRTSEVAKLEAERAEASEERKAKLEARADEARSKLKRTYERAEAALDGVEEETKAKVAAVQEQAAKGTADVKARCERRIAEIRADGDKRAAKLKRACDLAREALTP